MYVSYMSCDGTKPVYETFQQALLERPSSLEKKTDILHCDASCPTANIAPLHPSPANVCLHHCWPSPGRRVSLSHQESPDHSRHDASPQLPDHTPRPTSGSDIGRHGALARDDHRRGGACRRRPTPSTIPARGGIRQSRIPRQNSRAPRATTTTTSIANARAPITTHYGSMYSSPGHGHIREPRRCRAGTTILPTSGLLGHAHGGGCRRVERDRHGGQLERTGGVGCAVLASASLGETREGGGDVGCRLARVAGLGGYGCCQGYGGGA
jgi:hypothetical protein